MNTKDQINSLKSAGVIASKANYSICSYFIEKCKSLLLDPYRNEVYLIERYDPEQGNIYLATIGIGSARRIARETGELEEVSSPVFTFKNDDDFYPETCEITITRKGVKFSRILYFNEYSPKPLKGLWKTKPKVMIANITEMTVYRIAFPERFNTMYLSEELESLQRADYNLALKNKIAIDSSIDEINKKLNNGNT